MIEIYRITPLIDFDTVGDCSTGMLLSINVSKREVRDFAANRRFTFCRHKHQWVENDGVNVQFEKQQFS